MLRAKLITTVVTFIVVCSGSSSAQAQAQTCGDLWFRRNAVYKVGGYCFHTQRGIEAFGNAGCAYDDVASVPLSNVQHRIVAEIIEQEREMGCR